MTDAIPPPAPPREEEEVRQGVRRERGPRDRGEVADVDSFQPLDDELEDRFDKGSAEAHGEEGEEEGSDRWVAEHAPQVAADRPEGLAEDPIPARRATRARRGVDLDGERLDEEEGDERERRADEEDGAEPVVVEDEPTEEGPGDRPSEGGRLRRPRDPPLPLAGRADGGEREGGGDVAGEHPLPEPKEEELPRLPHEAHRPGEEGDPAERAEHHRLAPEPVPDRAPDGPEEGGDEGRGGEEDPRPYLDRPLLGHAERADDRGERGEEPHHPDGGEEVRGEDDGEVAAPGLHGSAARGKGAAG